MLKKINLRLKLRDIVYFGIPILLAVTTAFLPLKPILQQTMVAFVLIWFIGGYWLLPF
jgi:hypothetical protein